MRFIVIALSLLIVSACEMTQPEPAAPPPPPYDGPVDMNGDPIAPRAVVALGEACGGMMGLQCQGAETGATFCNYEPRDMCGAADAMGRCTIAPVACPRHYRPVCGCNGQTYANECLARAAGTGLAAYGVCEGDDGRGAQVGTVPPSWPPQD